jgi:hypothetical protein
MIRIKSLNQAIKESIFKENDYIKKEYFIEDNSPVEYLYKIKNIILYNNENVIYTLETVFDNETSKIGFEEIFGLGLPIENGYIPFNANMKYFQDNDIINFQDISYEKYTKVTSEYIEELYKYKVKVDINKKGLKSLYQAIMDNDFQEDDYIEIDTYHFDIFSNSRRKRIAKIIDIVSDDIMADIYVEYAFVSYIDYNGNEKLDEDLIVMPTDNFMTMDFSEMPKYLEEYTKNGEIIDYTMLKSLSLTKFKKITPAEVAKYKKKINKLASPRLKNFLK